MKAFLENLSHLEKIDVKDIVIDTEKFKLYSVNNYQPNDIVYYEDTKNNKLRRQPVSNHTYRLLKNGFGIYCDNVVYFMPTLDNKYCLNSDIEGLKKYRNKVLKYRAKFEYEFTKHIIEERNFILIKSYIDMYNRKLVDRDWVRKKIEGKVKDIEKVLEIDFPEAI